MTQGDINTLIAVGGFIVTVLGLAFAGWRWAVATMRASEAEARAEISKMYALVETRSSEYDGRLGLLKDRMSAFELKAAENYVSADRLRETENKLTAMFEKLLNRLDAFSVVLNNLVGRMERANDGRQ